MKYLSFLFFICFFIIGCKNNSSEYKADDSAADIFEIDDNQFESYPEDSLIEQNRDSREDVFKTIELFEVEIPRPVDSILRNYVIPEMKANGCAEYKLIDIVYGNDRLGFSIITPDELREMSYDAYGYNDDYEYGIVVSSFKRNKLRTKKSDRKKTIEIKDYTIYPIFDPPVCYFDPNNDFELIYPLNLY